MKIIFKPLIYIIYPRSISIGSRFVCFAKHLEMETIPLSVSWVRLCYLIDRGKVLLSYHEKM